LIHSFAATPVFPDMMDKDLSRLTVESFLLSIASLRRTDLRPKLNEIKIPVMGIYGERDNIVHPRNGNRCWKGFRMQRSSVGESPALCDAGQPQDFMESLQVVFLTKSRPRNECIVNII